MPDSHPTGLLPNEAALAPDHASRRRLLTLLGAGGVGALATLLSPKEAQAAHDGSNVFHLGQYNNAPEGSFDGAPHHTILDAPSPAGALKVINSGDGPAIQAEGLNGGGGVSATESSGPDGQAAVSGISNDTGIGDGSGVGVFGQSGSGVAIMGHADSGAGGDFASNSGNALQVAGRANMHAEVSATNGDVLFVVNTHPGADHVDAGGAISAESHGGHGVEGVSFPNGFESEWGGPQLGIGLRGVSIAGPGGEYGEGPGTGVQGLAGDGVGVNGFVRDGVGVDGTTRGTGIGVRASSHGDEETGVSSLDGIALKVEGRAVFGSAGGDVVSAGQSSKFVENPLVTADSHISVTLTGDPGSRQLLWVERQPGGGFTVHVSGGGVGKKGGGGAAIPFTYLIVEPG